MDWKKIGKKLIYPPIWVVLILTVLSAAALIAVFAKGLDKSPVSYVVYVFSFYTLTVLCVLCVKVLPKRYRKIKQKVYDNPMGNRYLTDAEFKTHVSLYGSLAVNLLYAATNLISGIWYVSAWSVTLAAYYMILAVMRFLLLRFIVRVGIGKDRYLELRRSRLCGIILMLFNIVLSGVVILVVVNNQGFHYNGILIYAMALYTFFVTTQAIINIIKYRKYDSPIMSTAKMISLTAALVSMLSLETAMLYEFGQEMTMENKRIMISLTGGGVGMMIIIMSIYMIVRSTKEIKNLRNKAACEGTQQSSLDGTPIA